MTVRKCPRCGHDMDTKSLHRTNPKTPDGQCHGCRPCFDAKLVER